MVLHVPGVELENQLTVVEQPIIEISVRVLRQHLDAEELLIPATTGSNVTDGDEGLRPKRLHGAKLAARPIVVFLEIAKRGG